MLDEIHAVTLTMMQTVKRLLFLKRCPLMSLLQCKKQNFNIFKDPGGINLLVNSFSEVCMTLMGLTAILQKKCRIFKHCHTSLLKYH